ncbi:hypothetical protein [Prevotella nigrescens]|uniref:DUF7255 family protein n=1 Tax=Prevotella nigrescens TaxID=28133 RepID=UPI0028D1B8D5|nr:hypothetical protein [Prevotella nigrescens]
MRKEKERILKQIVLQEYGEKKYPRLTKNQFLLALDFSNEVERIYKELGGTLDDFPINFGSWDISTPEFIIELDEENHFNRYRQQTLNSDIYQKIKGFPLNEYQQYCIKYESRCITHGGYWKNNSSENQFIKSDDNGILNGSGSSRWKQRAFYDLLRDVTGLIKGIPVIRLSIYQTFKGKSVQDIIRTKDEVLILDLVKSTIDKWK